MPHRDAMKLNISASLASVAVAIVLVALKLWALRETGALSVAASLADSALDLIASLGGLAAILYAAKPPDEDHAFGHSSIEDIFALTQAALVTASAGVIGWRAAARLAADQPSGLSAEAEGIAVMAVSIVLTLALVWWQRRVARQTGSKVVEADRLHYLSDLLPNIGAVAALAASAAFGVDDLDSIVALAAVLLLLIGAWRIGRGALDALMDRAADPALIAQIEQIARNHPGLKGFHDLKTRTAGDRVFVQIHVEIDGALTLNEAHAIGAGLRHAIMDAVPKSEVIVHKDPV
jgi:ferrous-iron efflux pump FieF